MRHEPRGNTARASATTRSTHASRAARCCQRSHSTCGNFASPAARRSAARRCSCKRRWVSRPARAAPTLAANRWRSSAKASRMRCRAFRCAAASVSAARCRASPRIASQRRTRSAVTRSTSACMGGIEGTADTIGLTVLGVAGAAVAAHAQSRHRSAQCCRSRTAVLPRASGRGYPSPFALPHVGGHFPDCQARAVLLPERFRGRLLLRRCKMQTLPCGLPAGLPVGDGSALAGPCARVNAGFRRKPSELRCSEAARW